MCDSQREALSGLLAQAVENIHADCAPPSYEGCLNTTAAAGPRGDGPSPPAHDGNTIVGGWEISSDGSDWKPDFDLAYARRH